MTKNIDDWGCWRMAVVICTMYNITIVADHRFTDCDPIHFVLLLLLLLHAANPKTFKLDNGEKPFHFGINEVRNEFHLESDIQKWFALISFHSLCEFDTITIPKYLLVVNFFFFGSKTWIVNGIERKQKIKIKMQFSILHNNPTEWLITYPQFKM